MAEQHEDPDPAPYKRQKVEEQAQTEKLCPAQPKRKKNFLFSKLEAPFFKGLQLPPHLKWVTVNAVSFQPA
jgi:hypothetical protein